MAKRPKKPKVTASVTSWESYDKRISDWKKNRAKKASLIKKHQGNH